jgi:hypothetical protein
MDQNINISLITKQISNRRKKVNKKDDDCEDDHENQSKIVLYDFFSRNEIKISEIISKISYYRNYYDVFVDNDFIDISKIGEKIIENVDLDTKYIVFNYNDEKRIGFRDFLFNLSDSKNNSNIKKFIFNILNTYTILLDSLIRLNENNICFFELNTENIVFSSYSRPILRNLENSIHIPDLNESYIKNIIKKTNNYTYKPLETHILFYLIVNDEETLSMSFIETICNHYVKSMDILSLFSQNYSESYEKACVETLKKYINKPKSEIISDILKYSHYWDNYSLSILYLHIIGNITNVFSIKGTFMNKFTMLLIKNIHPNPLKRETLRETSENYDKLFENADWTFINEFSNEKMKKLYDLLLS